MNGILLALGALAAGAGFSLAASRYRSLALAVALIAVILAGVACVTTAANILVKHAVAATTANWPLPLGSAQLALDGLSAWFLLVTGIAVCAPAIYAWGYFDRGNTVNRAFAPLLCVMVASIVLVVSAADVIVFLVAWEIMSVSAFFLVGLHDVDPGTRRGAWMYLVATHLGTALGVLPVLAAFVARTGGTHMSAFASAFGAADLGFCTMLFVIGAAGFGTKAGFIPFHVWLPAAHPVAPSPVSALMSGVVIKMGIYGLLRLISWLPELPVSCGIGLIVVSLVTALLGILYALGQRQLKRMLAYSSVENIGIIGLAIGVAILGRSLNNPALVAFGFAGALLHVLNHSLFKGLLFLSAGAVLHTAGTADIERLGGMARSSRANFIAFMAGSIAICALPPLNGFISEFLIYNGLLGELRELPMSQALLLASAAAVLALVGGIALAAFSKVLALVFLGEARDPDINVHATPFTMNAAMFLLVFACACVVAFPRFVIPALGEAMRPVGAAAIVESQILDSALNRTASLSLPLLFLALILIGLFGVRGLMPKGATAGGSGKTWGCGFARPAASMQYSGSSYSWKLLHSFRQLLRPTRIISPVTPCFPAPASCQTETRDLALERVYRPVFQHIATLCDRLRPLQHGRIQLYLVYIVLTVLVVFLVEAWYMRPDSANAALDIGAHRTTGLLGEHQ